MRSAPRRTSRGSWMLSTLPAAVGAGIFMLPAAASAHGTPLSLDFFKDCAAQAGNVLDRRVPNGRTLVSLHPRIPNGSAQTCADLTWAKFKGKIAVVTAAWNGRTSLTQWDCNHSSLAWGLYRKSGSSWVWVNGGYSSGNAASDSATCNYDGTGFPAEGNWGAFGIPTGASSTDTEYRIAFQAWSHDDVNLAHHDYCADPINCTWPVQFRFYPTSGTVWSTAKQDWVTWTPSTGNWNFVDSTTWGTKTQQWGQSGDWLAHGDYDGDSSSDFAVARPSSQALTWFIVNSSTGAWWQQQWGVNTDTLLRGADFDGDGRTDISIWRPSTGQWWAIQSGSGAGQVQVQAGSDSFDRPVVGDFDNDMRTDLILYRASSGRWRRVGSLKNFLSDTTWGINVDIPINADFDGDYKSDVAVYRVTNSTFYWINSSNGYSWQSQWGAVGDRVVSPSFVDGDTISDRVIYRQSERRFYYVYSTTGAGYFTQWGSTTSDEPAADFMR